MFCFLQVLFDLDRDGRCQLPVFHQDLQQKHIFFSKKDEKYSFLKNSIFTKTVLKIWYKVVNGTVNSSLVKLRWYSCTIFKSFFLSLRFFLGCFLRFFPICWGPLFLSSSFFFFGGRGGLNASVTTILCYSLSHVYACWSIWRQMPTTNLTSLCTQYKISTVSLNVNLLWLYPIKLCTYEFNLRQ